MSLRKDSFAYLANENEKLGEVKYNEFDGVSEYASSDNPLAGFTLGTPSPFTLCIEYYPVSMVAGAFVFGTGISYYTTHIGVYWQGTQLYLMCGNGVAGNIRATGLVHNALQWNRLTYRYTGGGGTNAYLCLNGSCSPETLSVAPTPSDYPPIVGYHNHYRKYASYKVRNVAVYNRDVGADGRALHQAGGLPHSPVWYVPGYCNPDSDEMKDLTRYKNHLLIRTTTDWDGVDGDAKKVWL